MLLDQFGHFFYPSVQDCNRGDSINVQVKERSLVRATYLALFRLSFQTCIGL